MFEELIEKLTRLFGYSQQVELKPTHERTRAENLIFAMSHLRRAIARTEQQLDDFAASKPDVCRCCLGAAFGGTYGPYDKLVKKLDRQNAWLLILRGKTGEFTEIQRQRHRANYFALTNSDRK